MVPHRYGPEWDRAAPQALPAVMPHMFSDGFWSGCAWRNTCSVIPSIGYTDRLDSLPPRFLTWEENVGKSAGCELASGYKFYPRCLKKWSQNATIWSQSGALAQTSQTFRPGVTSH